MTSDTPAIETNGLTRRFGDVVAVDDLELRVERGEVYGFLGPNGAGKSTTINVLLGFVPPTAGSATVLGRDVETESVAVRRRTGVLPEDVGVYDRLTARRHVRFAVDCKDAADDPDAVLDRVGLADAIDRPAGEFSTGMKQRLALSIALVGDPDLLILDEPTSGLDPNGARELRDLVRAEAERGTTVFFSSHSLAQVEAICDRVGIMRDGRLVADDDVDALKARLEVAAELTVTVDRVPDGAVDRIASLEGVADVRLEGDRVAVSLSTADAKAAVVDALADVGCTVEDIASREPSLEDLFAAYTAGGAAASDGRPRATADGGGPA